MIERTTTLVLGAGASMDFDFPSGWGLKRLICDKLISSASVRAALFQSGYDGEQTNRFASSLQRSGDLSVDAFLGARSDLVPIGKLAIAAVLIPFEQPNAVHNNSASPSWLDILFARMGAPHDRWSDNKLSVVTFNYDRVVEFFLHSTLVAHFGLSDAKADELRRATVPIVHVHGLLGEFDYGRRNAGRQFEPHVTAPVVREAAAAIRILHEGDAADEVFVQARKILDEAEEVVFLGFGFHPDNCSRLGLDKAFLGRDKRIVGSCIEMTGREREVATERIGGGISLFYQYASLPSLLREVSILGH